MEWFEVVGRRYADTLEPEQFFYSMLTRSQRISHENLRLRDPRLARGLRALVRAPRRRRPSNDDERAPPPMLTPYRVRGLTLANRIVVSPMAMYSATDGLIDDFHLAHLGARAMGGAALVFAEMTCVSPDARITPGCLGLWNDEQAGAVEAARRPHPLPSATPRPASSSATPAARARRKRRLGGHRPAARSGRLAADLGLGAALSAAQPGPARDDARRHGPRARRFRRRRRGARLRPASIGWSCIARTAICCRASCRR